MTTFTRDWDSAYEAAPTDDNYLYEIDNYHRQLIQDIRERMVIDHIWKIGGTDGEHKQITLSAPLGSKPTAATDKMFIYSKDVSGMAEAFIEDEDGDEVQLTQAGALCAFPSGTKMMFYQDTAPIGWTIADTLDDKLLFITKGSAAGGEVGGGVHSSGSWTLSGMSIDDHVLSVSEMPSHSHTLTGWKYMLTTDDFTKLSSKGSGDIETYTSSSVGGDTGHSHGITNASSWRPAAYCAIVATKD